jgi:hypothetical protein
MIRFASLSVALVACTSAPSPTTDPLAGETNDGSKADGTSTVDTFGMFTVTKIGAFECNGAGSCTHLQLARTNRSTMTCADGSAAATCDARTFDLSSMAQSPDQSGAGTAALQASANDGTPHVIVRGDFVHGTNPLYPDVDWVTFAPTEIWISQMDGAVMEGLFVLVQDNGLRCFEPPCAAYTEYKLNSTRSATIDGLDWGPDQPVVTSPGALSNRVATAIANGQGAIVVGDRTTGTIMGLPEQLRSVNQVWLQLN